MKRTISFLLVSCAVLFGSAQTVVDDPTAVADASNVKANTAPAGKNFYRDFSRWSISLEGGLNAFDGDVYQANNHFFKSVRGNFSGGITGEFTFTPIVSLGLSYYFLPIHASSEYYYLDPSVASSKYQETDATHHQLYPFLSVNLLRVFNKNTRTHWGVWANLGLGTAYFDSEYKFYKKKEGVDDNHLTNADYSLDFADKIKGEWAVIVPVGVNIEYNFTRNLALGVKINYTSYNRDDLEGTKQKQENDGKGLNYAGVTNDFVASGFANLRWKFAATKPHTRNIRWDEFDTDAADAKRMAQEALDKVNKIPPVKNYDDAIDHLQDQIDSLKIDVDKLKKFMSPDGPDDDVDGVPNVRDLEPNTPPNTPVDFYGRSVSTAVANAAPAVFFDFDKYNLDNEAQQEVYKAAQILKANPNFLCEIRAYCDVVGSDKYNKQLSINRANRVKDELVKVYGISPSRIVANGNGRILEPNYKYRINRRAEFHFSE